MSRRIACDALLFDLDGVLADTTELVERSWTEWAESRGLDPDFAPRVHGRPALELVASLPPSSWAVVTSGNKSQAAARLGAIELKPPQVVITSEDIDKGKP